MSFTVVIGALIVMLGCAALSFLVTWMLQKRN